MKKRIEYFFILLVSIVCTGSMKAQSQHWQCNPYDWQYDMTMYITLSINNVKVSNMSDYMIAAFCGDECRGVATVNTLEHNGLTIEYGYLRIRSNQQEDEDITFKVYDYINNSEFELEDTVSFVANRVEGLPSKPFVMKHVSDLRGDVYCDGIVDGTDIQAIINLIVDGEYDEKADVYKDGIIDGTDIQEVINIIVDGM